MAFNKMFVMLPVMLAARKLDGEDPQVSIIYRPGEDGGFAGYENPAARNHTTFEAKLERETSVGT